MAMSGSGSGSGSGSSSGSGSGSSPKPGAPSPWSQIVAAAAPPSSPPPPPPPAAAVEASAGSEESGAVAEGLDNGTGPNGGAGRRPAWNRPSNGASSSDVRPVMGADSWPALSKPAKSARASTKSPSPSESAKGLVDSASVPQLQGTGNPVSSSQRQVRDNASTNNKVSTYHKSFKHSNANPSSNGGYAPQHSAPQGSMAASGSHNHGSSPKDHQPRTGFVSNDHPQHRNSFRNRNGGPHQRGDGPHHHNYGSRRDHDRGNQEWNNHRNFNGRDNYMSPRFAPRFIRPPPPPNPAQFYPPPPPPPMRPFGGMGYSELPPQMVYVPPPPLDPIRGVPYVSPIPPNAMFFQPPDSQLHTMIVKQIDYYFSNENLIKDIYLRQNMDDQGLVPIHLIAGFKKVRLLTDNVQIVLDAVRTSTVVEVLGEKIRRRDDWMRWIIPPFQFPDVTGSQTIGKLAEQVQSIALEATNDDSARELDVSQNRSYGDLNSQFLLSTSEGTGQVGIQVSNHSISARN